jgi:hypothetical protein
MVRTSKVLAGPDDFTPSGKALRSRHRGMCGVITDFSDSHGLCYKVVFDGLGEFAWFSPEELDIVIEL